MRFTLWDPFRDMAAFQRAVNSLFREGTTRGRTSYPPMELIDKGEELWFSRVKCGRKTFVEEGKWILALLTNKRQPKMPGQNPFTLPYTPKSEEPELLVRAELAGVDKDAVEINILGDTLAIAGEKKPPVEKDATYIRHERPYGNFRRVVDLPYSVDNGKVAATYKDGILTITLPKAEEAKPRQIKVQ